MKHSQTGIAKKFLFLMVGLLMAIGVNAQSITVSGTVTDPTGEPLIGASVLAEGTTIGASTDIDGNFTINVAPNAVLVVSYVGYDTQRVPVEGRSTVNVELSENSVMLSEVVAIGYGTVKKQDATGSVAVIKPDEIDAGLATSVQDMLVGQTPGVVVTTDGGNPSGGATIRIRGGASLSASNDPLIVLDGVPLSSDTPLGMGSPLAMINPESIESMTVLKDASATAIYGSRASNGVILITTKKGRSGKPQVTFTANLYVDHARKLNKVLDAGDFRNLVLDRFGEGSAAAGYLGNASTNWQDEIFRTAVSSDYALSVAGSAGVLPYRVDVSYTNKNGILEASSMDRVTVGVSLTPRLFDDHLSINANVKGFYVHNDWGQTGAISQALSFNPTLPVHTYVPISGGTAADSYQYLFNGYTEPYTVSGGLANLENNASYNPVATINQTKNYSGVYRSTGNIQFDYSFHFLPELHANLNLGYDVTKSDNYYIIEGNSHMAWKDHNNYGGGYSNHEYAFRSNTLLEFYLNYKKEFESIKSMLDVTAGYTWSRDAANGWNDGASSNAGISDTPGLSTPVVDANGNYLLNWTEGTAAGTLFQADSVDPDGNYHWKNHLQLLSFFGRLNYTFNDRYLLTATVRGDATSRFSKENRWGIFPAVALGWRIDQEAFMESSRTWLSDLKLRLGWGETGQQAVGDNFYNYIATYTASMPGSYYTNGAGGWYVPAFPNAYNDELTWETTTTYNVGIDYGFLNNRITGSIEAYLRKTRDLISYVPIPYGSATTNYLYQNIGDMENYGIEFSIVAKPIVTNDFSWTLSYNVGWNHNEITDLGGKEFGVGGGLGDMGGNCMIHREGYPAYSFYLYQQVYDANGNPIEGAYVDQNGDGQIDDQDRVVRYSKDPKVTMTFGSQFRYKNWDLGFTLRASIGNYVYASALRGGTTTDGLFRNNQLSNVFESDTYFSTSQALSDYWVRNASFLRCDNINVGYTFDNLLNDKLKLRVFAAVQNPFVITKYAGLDPEVESGVDGEIYPRTTSWSLGVVANF